MIFAKIIFTGFIVGFLSALPVGSSALEIVRRGCCYSFKEAFLVSLGTATTDAFYALLAYLGVSHFILNSPVVKDTAGIIAAVVIAIVGIYIIYESKKVDVEPIEKIEKKEIPPYLTGVMITIFNPFVLVFWAGILSLASRSQLIGNDRLLGLFFLIFAILGILTWTAVLSYLASLGKINIHSKLRKYANLIVGVILVASSVVILVRLFFFK